MDKENKKEPSYKDKKNFLEWTVFAVSLLMVAGILIYLGYKTYTHQPSPPNIQVEYRPNPTRLTPYRYHLIVNNTGGETAEEVIIELVLKKDTIIMEKAEMNLPFVPQSSKREGWINFTMDPNEADTVVARVMSFKKP